MTTATRLSSLCAPWAPYQSRCASDRPAAPEGGLGGGLFTSRALRRGNPTCWPSPKRPGFGCESPNEVIQPRASVAASELLCSLEPPPEITAGRQRQGNCQAGSRWEKRGTAAGGPGCHGCARVGQLGGELLGPSTSCGCTFVSAGEISTIRIRVVLPRTPDRQRTDGETGR